MQSFAHLYQDINIMGIYGDFVVFNAWFIRFLGIMKLYNRALISLAVSGPEHIFCNGTLLLYAG